MKRQPEIVPMTDEELYERFGGIQPRSTQNVVAGSEEDINSKKRSFKWLVYLSAVLLVLLAAGNAMVALRPKEGSENVHVLSLSLPSSVSLYEGERYVLIPEADTVGNELINYQWSTDAGETVSVNSFGEVTALLPGKAVITVFQPESGLSASCTVNVVQLGSIKLSSYSLVLGKGENAVLTADDGENEISVELTCADETIVSVDEDGTVAGLETGETEITVSAYGYADSVCTVKVSNAPKSIEFETRMKLCDGESRTVAMKVPEGSSCSTFTYSSSDPEIVSVSGDVLTAHKKGTAKITATAYNGISVTEKLTVISAPVRAKFAQKSYSAYTGMPFQLAATDSTGVCQQFTYTSSDPATISVTESGTVTALKKGSATITATSYNGKTATCTVNAKIVDYATPYTSGRVLENIEALAASYPELISTEVIGQSSKGTDLVMLKMGHGEKKALVVAEFHSREHITVNYLMRVIEEYADAYYSKSGKYGYIKMKDMFEAYTLYLVPMVNPDGLDICTDGQPTLYSGVAPTDTELKDYKNTATGVNLNRNFPFHWGVETVNTTTPDYNSYAGNYEGSEPETQALMQLCADNAFEWMFSFHVQGGMIYWQDNYNEDAPNAKALAHKLSGNCDLNLMRSSSLAGISGGFENWFRSVYNRPSFCIELIDDKYSTTVNKFFEQKTNWSKTRYIVALGMMYG